MLLGLLQVVDEAQNYIDLLFSTKSPIFIAGLVLFVLLVILNTFYQFIFRPLRNKFQKEKHELELKNAKILALFAERNPNPVLKVAPNGSIVAFNNSAEEILKLNSKINYTFEELMSINELNHHEAIEKNRNIKFTKSFENRIFDIQYNGIKDLEFAHIYFFDITEREEFSNQLTQYQKQVSGLVNKLDTQIETERGRISKDLHDSICQTLTIANMYVRKFEANESLVIEHDDIKKIESMLSRSVKEIRDIINDFKPIDLEELGLEKSIQTLVEKNTSGTELKGTYSCYNVPDNIKDEIEICIFRIAQEAIANIIKHSAAKNFSIDINCDAEEISLIISDDGAGFETKRLKNGRYVSSGNGVVNIQERVIYTGGDLEIDSSPGNGTTLIITLPLEND